VRLRERQGAACAAELADAQAYLRGVYAWFTEGFSFPDLVEAAALMGNASREKPPAAHAFGRVA
jgi:isopropylmalate/homocitrate/citramalate synthase